MFANPDEVRDSFRIVPSRDNPLRATLNKKPIEILNISSGGFCCKKTDLEVGKEYFAEVILPPKNNMVSGLVKVLQNDDAHHCRCQFQDLPQVFEDDIHLYVLNRQKEEQKKNKSSSIKGFETE